MQIMQNKQIYNQFVFQFYNIARAIGKGGLTSSAKMLPPKVLAREEVGLQTFKKDLGGDDDGDDVGDDDGDDDGDHYSRRQLMMADGGWWWW